MISGSDVVTGWTNDGGEIWSVPWQPLPLIVYPDGWPDLDEYSRRREMVFFDDSNPLLQVLSPGELASGRFWMDDAAQRMRIHVPGNPNSSLVEIAVRDQGVMATGTATTFSVGSGSNTSLLNYEIAAMHLGANQRSKTVRWNTTMGTASKPIPVRCSRNHIQSQWQGLVLV